jgi:two-component system, sporulation sensor kinase C
VARRKDGQPIHIEVLSKPVAFAERQATQLVVRDITERKRAEEQTRRYHEELEEEVRQRTARIQELERQRTEIEKLAATGRMAAGAAHEINNPLAGIRNAFLLIKDAIADDHPYAAYVGRITTEIDRIARIVRDMSDLYRSEQRTASEFNVAQTIRDVVSLVDGSGHARAVSIALRLPADPIVVHLPEDAVRQVLYNTIINAIEASSEGGVVEVGASLAQERLLVTVADQGPGIPGHLAERVFEPFFSTKTDRAGGGFGLGLSISSSLVQAMGGKLEFGSAADWATVCRISLPQQAAREGNGP